MNMYAFRREVENIPEHCKCIQKDIQLINHGSQSPLCYVYSLAINTFVIKALK